MKSDEIAFDDITKEYFEVADYMSAMLSKAADARISYKDTTGKKVAIEHLFLKAIKHFNAIILLCKNGFGEDALVLDRVLVELYILMVYFADDSKEAIIEKRAFSYVKKDFDDRKRYFDAQKNSIDEETLKIILNKLEGDKEKFCDEFNDVNDMSKRFCIIAEKANQTDLFRGSYAYLSAIVHSSSTGMNSYFRDDKDTFAYWQNDNNVMKAINYALVYVNEVVLIFKHVFGLVDIWNLDNIAFKIEEITEKHFKQISDDCSNMINRIT